MATRSDKAIQLIWSNQNYRLSVMRRIFKYSSLKANGCIEWHGNSNIAGYGVLNVYKCGIGAHRLSWMFANGKPVPSGLFVCHACDNPPCINPEHLFVGTHQENMWDCTVKGRNKMGKGHKMNVLDKNPFSRLKRDDVLEIRQLIASRKYTLNVIAKKFGVCRPTISHIKLGLTWSTLENDA